MSTTETCCICLEDIHPYDKEVTTCKHKYHMECITKWLNEHKTCPLCRNQIFNPVKLPKYYYDELNNYLDILRNLVDRINTEIVLKPYHKKEFHRFRDKTVLTMRKGDLEKTMKKVKQVKLYSEYLLKIYKE